VVCVGDVIKITDGPFAGLEGRLKDSGRRVLIVIEINGRLVDVEMDRDWVTESVPESVTASAR
jgi:transcription antitermination factor NusG